MMSAAVGFSDPQMRRLVEAAQPLLPGAWGKFLGPSSACRRGVRLETPS
jgi:hypothetical protein